MINNYINILSKITANIFANMYDPFYSQLTENICQDVLDEANKMSNQFVIDYKEKNNYEIIARPAKKMERIIIKKQYNKPDIHFKVNSDFSAFRINTKINDITNKLDDLENYFKNINGLFFLRNPIIKDNNDFYLLKNYDDFNSKYKDIVVYAFAYHPKYKYIMEFQVGHEFASYVFTRDSYLRDHKNTELIDLWKNNFYEKVKNKILGVNTEINLLDELNNLYDGKSIEPELYKIIEKIEKFN